MSGRHAVVRYAGMGLALAAGLCLGMPAGAFGGPGLAEPAPHLRVVGESHIPTPIWMAVLEDGQGVRTLLKPGDPVFRAGNPHPIGILHEVGAGLLTLVTSPGGSRARVAFGRPLPGAPDIVFRDAFLIGQFEYRQRTRDRGQPKILNGEAYLVAVEGRRAVLQRDVEPPPTRMELPAQRLAGIQLVQAGPQTWEMSAQDLRVAMESGEAIALESVPIASVPFGLLGGQGLDVQTPVVKGRLDNAGFVVYSPELAARAGLQVGDRIVEVNTMPINGPSGLYAAYTAIKRDPAIQVFEVLVKRGDNILALTYRAR